MTTTFDENPQRDLLRGRIAIVTGAGAGVGRGIAEALAAAGAHVVIAARRLATGVETEQIIRAAGGSALAIETDVADRAAVERLIGHTVAAFGGLDIVIHNASSGRAGKPALLEDIDEAGWYEQSAVGLEASFYLARAAFPYLRDTGRGRFIVLSSSQGLHGGAMNPAYPAVKNGQRGFVKALAREWGPHGIIVNAIAPAALTGPAASYLEKNPQFKAQIHQAFPLQRLGDSRDDIGSAVVVLCSDYWRYSTGLTIPVDGGNYSAL